MQHTDNFYQLVEECRPQIREISALDVSKMFENKTNFILIDVRQDNEWVRGRIPSAIHLSLNTIEVKILHIIPDLNSQLVLYCAAGYRSVIATFNLQQMGYTNVSSMEGGIGAWVGAGNKIVI